MMRQFLLLPVLALLAVPLFAENAEARKLADEALAILKANAARQATPEEYATAIVKLEKAQALLEKSGAGDSSQAQDVNTQLFWARRFSNVQVIAALDKMRGAEGVSPPPPVKPTPEPSKPVAKTNDPAALPDYVPQNEAKKAFAAAEQSAKSHSSDDYAVALIWFKMANDYSGTDYAMKALNLAREAQARFAAKIPENKPEELPDTPEMAPVRKGDELVEKGELEQAIEQYMSSLRQKSNIVVHRKLGHTYFTCAEKMKVDLIPKFEQLEPQYRAAYNGAWVTTRIGFGASPTKIFNPDYGPWIEARNKYQALARQIQTAKNYYLYGQWEFERVVKLAPGGKDLDAAAHAALCLSARGDSQSSARDYLKRVIKDYVPANQTEMTVYEYCKTELERISK